MKFLGIDFGEAKIGLAISEGHFARPLTILSLQGVALQIEKIMEICKEEQIEKIVIGVSEGKSAEKAREFGKKLAAKSGIRVEFRDETLSSQKASKLMIQLGKSRLKRRKEDAVAAAFILQDYLDDEGVES